jgi:hypothetical protein
MSQSPAELHVAVEAAVKARLELACAATSGPWIAEYSGETGHCVIPADAQSTREYVARTQLYAAHFDAEHIAVNNPVAVIFACEADLERLSEHNPGANVIALHWSACSCSSGKVCPELRRLVRVYAIEIPDGPTSV